MSRLVQLRLTAGATNPGGSGLLGSQQNQPTTRLNGLYTTQAILGQTLPVLIGQQRLSWQLIWYGDFQSAKAKQAGGSGLSNKGPAQYVYSASVIGALCLGPCTNFLGVWDSNGRFATDTYSEDTTGTTTYTPANSDAFIQDIGAGVTTAYSVTVNDYGSSGPTTYSGTQQVPLTYTTSPTPAPGQYTVNGSNQYVFNAAQSAAPIVVNYVAYVYNIQENELDIVPSTSPYQVTVQNQAAYIQDLGVTYYPSGVALNQVSGTPSVTGTYNPNNGNYLFAPGDALVGVTINYEWNNFNTDANSPNTYNLTFFNGALGQEPWSYLSSNYPNAALGYSELCYVASQGMYLGYSPDMPQLNFEILGSYSFGNGVPDACPSDAIEGILTSSGFGIYFPPEFIDSSLQGIARDYWCANNFFISTVLTDQSSAIGTIGSWCEAGQVYVSWDEGVMKFIPLGDQTTVANGHQYNPPTQPVIDLDDNDFIADSNEDPIKIETKPWQQIWNRVKARWRVRTNSYNDDTLEIDDSASINQYGLMAEGAQSWEFLCTENAVQWAAQMRLQRIQGIYTTYSFTLRSNFAFLSPGDIITVSDGLLNGVDYMFGRTPVRITKMTDDPMKGIIIEAEAFPYGVGQAELSNRQAQIPSNTNQAPQAQPGNTTPLIFEIPDAASGYTGNEVYIFANSPNSNWGGCQLWVSYNGTDYNLYDNINTPARIGTLVNYLPFSTDPDTTDTLTVRMQSADSDLQSVTEADLNAFVTLSGVVSTGGDISPQQVATQGSNYGTTVLSGSGYQGPVTVTLGTDNPNPLYSSASAWNDPNNVTGDIAFANTAATNATAQTTTNNSPIPGPNLVYGPDWDIASISPNQLRTSDEGGYGDNNPNRLMPFGPIFGGYGFNVPTGSSITGVTFSIGYISQTSTSAYIANAALVYNGSIIGTVKSLTATFEPFVQELNLGSSTDEWGAALTPAIVNDPSFSVGIQVWIGTSRVFVGGGGANQYGAYATVYYTTTAGQSAQQTHLLECTFGNGGNLTVPLSGIGAISGVSVNLNSYATTTSGSPSPALYAQLLYQGAQIGVPLLVQGSPGYPTSSTPYTVGSSTNLWGVPQLLAIQTNDPSFGVSFFGGVGGVSGVASTFDVNDVAMTVYWGGGSTGVPWDNPGNVGTVFTSPPTSPPTIAFATATLTDANNTIWLVANGYGFSLPYGFILSGIQVSFEAYTSDATDANIAVLLFQNNQLIGLTKNVTPTTTNTTYTLGSAVDLWGQNGLGLDQLNSSTFGAAISMSGVTGADEFVRNVRVTLYGSSVTNLELIAYEDSELVGQNTYALTNLRRGILGSYPVGSPAGSLFARMDEASVIYQVPSQYVGQSIYFKFLSYNAYGNQLQSLASVTPYVVTISGTSPGAIDAATGALTTGTMNNPVSRIDTAVSAIHGTYGVNNIPAGYGLLKQPGTGSGTPTWTPIITGGGGSGSVGNVYVIEQAGDFTAAPWDYVLVDTSGGNVTATLPSAVSNPNTTIDIKKTTSDANTVTIIGTGTDTVEGQSSLTINYQGSSVSLASDGVGNWFIY